MRIRVKQQGGSPLNSPLGQKVIWSFVLLGLLLTLIGSVGTVNYYRMEAAEATIDRIEEAGDGYEVYVSYTHGAEGYEDVRLGYWDSEMEAGKTIPIRLSPDEPGRPVSGGPVFLLIFGLIYTAGSLLILAVTRFFRPKEARR